MTEYAGRRQQDQHPLEIDLMIAAEDDPAKRALLLVLQSIHSSLIANTSLTQSLSTRFDTHLTNFSDHTKREEKMLNQGRGAWIVAAWVFGIAQVAVVTMAIQLREELDEHRKVQQENRMHATRIELRLGSLEKYVQDITLGGKK